MAVPLQSSSQEDSSIIAPVSVPVSSQVTSGGSSATGGTKRKAELDSKPPLKLLNPMAFRRPLPKALKVKCENAAPPKAPAVEHQEEVHGWRQKLFEGEFGLLMEKIETEKKLQQTEIMKMKHMEEIHGLQMTLLLAKHSKINNHQARTATSQNSSSSTTMETVDMETVDHLSYPNSQNSNAGSLIH